MSFPTRSLSTRLPGAASQNVSSGGPSPMLVARIAEKKAELEHLKELRDLSAAVAGQMEALEQKLSTLSDGTEAIAMVIGNWHNVLRAISMASILQTAKLDDISAAFGSIARHKQGQYDYILSVTSPDSSILRDYFSGSARRESTLSFGFNLLQQVDDHTGRGVCGQASPLGVETPGQIMAVAEPIARLVTPPPGNEATGMKTNQTFIAAGQEHQKENSDSSIDVVEHPMDRVVSISTNEGEHAPCTPSRSTSASSQSRIEDSLEAIDRLEEQLEKMDAAITPKKSGSGQVSPSNVSTTGHGAARRNASPLQREVPTRLDEKPTAAQARSAQRRMTSIETTSGSQGSPTKSASRRSTVSRPTSLLPPKPPSKSTKPPTKPSFELPGEAVARRIKEQREARLAQQVQEKAAAASPQRTRSTKLPTRPNFELPGEAISRRKREEREARLKAQEEEERKRREFKARPIRANLASAPQPRETVTSRARLNKGAEISQTVQASSTPSKKSSDLGTAALGKPVSVKSPQAMRGRGALQTIASRAASTSTSSTSGQRSNLSAEELEQQRIKGREVFERDNHYLEDKERERRERELKARLAREQAAERSRQAGREWAEKQRRKHLGQ
ncbi:DASH complex subunit DAD2 [Colletotrichum trifolii]|uniref:DASH complex subunit DAD2 n=1 Tax=Colletotrichum trifolii TaxID=5466 RepID=A0A4R8RVT8_COLTR|nr:DASH complex subunit DAD2 [Colletotrichum trifolii]